MIDTPNQVWSGDTTYVKLDKGFAYLGAIIDWGTKKILSCKLSNTMDADSTTSIPQEALLLYPQLEIFNSDQGSQYTAREHVDILTKNNISISMDAKRRSVDNIAIERFWRTLKYEDIHTLAAIRLSRRQKKGIEEYINLYNQERLHSRLDYATPNEAYY